MQIYHFYHRAFARRFLRSELGRFDLSVWLHVFGLSLVSVFIPIVFLRLDYTLADVLWFHVIALTFNVPLNFVAQWLVRHIGAIMTIAIGLVFQVAFLVLIYALTPHDWPMLITIALAAAIADACYWVAHLYVFIRVSPHHENISRDASTLEIARSIGSISAPAIGAAIFLITGAQDLLAVSAMIVALSILPLLTMRGITDRPMTPPMPFRAFFATWGDTRDYVARALHSVHAVAESTIWPLFIFFTFTTITSVAAVPIIVAITTVIFTLFVGRIEKTHRTRAITTGALLTASIWLLRLVVREPAFMYGSIFLVGFFSILIAIPVDSNIFESGERKDPLAASTYRNAFGMCARLIFFGVIILLTEVFHMSFLIAAASMLGLAATATIALPSRPRNA